MWTSLTNEKEGRHSSSEVPRHHLRRDAGERRVRGDHRLDECIDVAEERHVEAFEDLVVERVRQIARADR